jgi:serine/threonine protein kinase
MLELMYGLPTMPDQEQGPGALQKWNKTWRQLLLDKVFESDEDYDKVVNILLGMIKVDPEERLSADGCLERGCHNGLFRKTRDGHIVGANDTEVNTPGDATSQAEEAEEAEEADDGTKTPTLRSPQWTEGGMNDTSFLVGNLWGSINGDRAESMNLPLTIKDSISGTPVRRPTTPTSTGLSWSLTIGPSNSDSDGGFDMDSGSRQEGGLVAGLFIRRDRFTGSLESKRSSEDAAEEQVEERVGERVGEAGPGQRNLTVTDQPGIGSAAGLDSFEKRLIELLAG